MGGVKATPAVKKRIYQEVWERIKKRDKCILIVHPDNIKRVKKAVIKEKLQDSMFKVANDNDWFRLVITYNPVNQELEFKLKARLGLEDKVIT